MTYPRIFISHRHKYSHDYFELVSRMRANFKFDDLSVHIGKLDFDDNEELDNEEDEDEENEYEDENFDEDEDDIEEDEEDEEDEDDIEKDDDEDDIEEEDEDGDDKDEDEDLDDDEEANLFDERNDQIVEAVINRIKQCNLFIAIGRKATSHGDWCRIEIEYADSIGKPIVIYSPYSFDPMEAPAIARNSNNFVGCFTQIRKLVTIMENLDLYV